MAYVLFAFGLTGMLVGGVITYQVFSFFEYIDTARGTPRAVAMLLAAWPGLSMIVGGMVLLAAGEALLRLAAIARSAEGTLAAAEATARALTDPARR